MDENDAAELAARLDLAGELDYFIGELTRIRATLHDTSLEDLKADTEELGYRLGSLTFADDLV